MTRPGWADRHPAAATTAGLFSLTLMCMMFSVHPVAALTVTALAGVGGAVWLVDRERDRRAATAERADAANRELLRLTAQPTFGNPLHPRGVTPTCRAPKGSGIADRHVMNSYPTTPLGTRPIRERISR